MSGAVSFDRVADCYDATRGGAARGSVLVTDLRPYLRPGSVLEVAVGTGLVAAALIEAGFPAVGVDISTEMLRYAAARLGPRVALGDARHLPIRTASVENVIFVMALHLVGDIPAAMAEAARVIRPGGRVAAVHGTLRGSVATDLSEAATPLENIRPARPDDEGDVATAAQAAGLEIVHQGWTSEYPHDRTPREVADQIEQRVWSYLWNVQASEWDAYVVPAVRALRSLPDLDRPRPWPRQHRLSVFSRP
jgi:SAM-dependent methyltransferase